MELHSIWKVILRRWWIIAIPAMVALVYAGYGYLSRPQAVTYRTQISYTAALPPGEEAISYEDEALAPWTSSEYVANALADWVRTGSFATEVSGRLAADDIEIPWEAIRGAITADNTRSVLVLYLSWPDAAQLESIAAAATTTLQERSGQYFPQLEAGKVRVIALDEAIITPVPPPLSSRFDPVIRFGLGLVAGVALAFLVEYLDPSVRERRDLEAIGLTVLAEIPRQRR